MVIADLDFEAINRRKLRMDSVGHYARPDVVRLLLDPRPRPIVEEAALGWRAAVDKDTCASDQHQALTAHPESAEKELETVNGDARFNLPDSDDELSDASK